MSGSAEDPADYSATVADVAIPADAASGSSTLVITPVDDDAFEGDETITVSGALDGLASAVNITLTAPLITAQQQNSGGPTFDDGAGPLPRTARRIRRWAPRWPPPTRTATPSPTP